jgi:precorrin-4 methylase
VPLHDIMNHDLAAHNVAFTDGIQEEEAALLTNPQRRYIATTTRPVKRGDSLRDTYAAVDDSVHFVVFYEFALQGVPTFTAVDASVADLAAEIAQIEVDDAVCLPKDTRCEARLTSTLVEAAEAQRALLATLHTVPERAMQQMSMATLGAVGAAHPVAILGRASGLHNLVRDLPQWVMWRRSVPVCTPRVHTFPWCV